jgi:HSP20 family protein
MTMIRRTSPAGELLSLRQAMDRLFDETFTRPLAGPNSEDGRAMPLDIYTTPDSLIVEAALPGVKPEDVDVSILGDTLTLTATSATERSAEQGGYHVQEVRRGRFVRSVALPAGLRTDAATANFEHGMLHLAIPKAEQAKARQIPVTAPTEGTATPITAGSAATEEPHRGTPDRSATKAGA